MFIVYYVYSLAEIRFCCQIQLGHYLTFFVVYIYLVFILCTD